MINDAGGTAIAIRVDHTVQSEVKAVFKRIDRKHMRLDILVDSVAGEDPMMGQWGNFWQADLKNADARAAGRACMRMPSLSPLTAERWRWGAMTRASSCGI
jgi:hypothetical protein